MEVSLVEPSPPAVNVLNHSDPVLSIWKRAVSDYFNTAELSKKDSEWLSQAKCPSDVVASTIQVQNIEKASHSGRSSHRMFLSAVLSAGTHNEFMEKIEFLKGESVPSVVSNQVATFLRYASAIDAFLDAIGSTTFASAFIFGAIRFMLDIAVKNVKLLIAIHDKFADVDLRLRRLDEYLALKTPSQAVRLMTIRVLVNTLRFCGLATRYFSSATQTKVDF